MIRSLTDAVTSVDCYYDDSGFVQQERPQRQVPVPEELEDLVVKGKAADFLNTFHKIINNYCNILLFNVVSHAVTHCSIDSSLALNSRVGKKTLSETFNFWEALNHNTTLK